MKKNVFQGFEGKELENASTIKGGISYRPTSSGGQQTDEEAVTAAGEVDPWTDETQNYTCTDARWDNCKG
ncbi:MAG: hypothetical protein MK105_04875 [Crocinitomicaceae bacterium]|nr:hypothetical protein [Crocinitomicaceae bacterium]